MKMPVIATVIIVFVIAFAFNLIKRHKKWKKKVAVLKQQRSGATKGDFIEYFLGKGYTAATITLVYDKVQDYFKGDHLVLLPEDDFQGVYEIDDEEWEYVLESWFKEIGTQIPPQRYFDYLNSKYASVSFDYLMELMQGKVTGYNTRG